MEEAKVVVSLANLEALVRHSEQRNAIVRYAQMYRSSDSEVWCDDILAIAVVNPEEVTEEEE